MQDRVHRKSKTFQNKKTLLHFLHPLGPINYRRSTIVKGLKLIYNTKCTCRTQSLVPMSIHIDEPNAQLVEHDIAFDPELLQRVLSEVQPHLRDKVPIILFGKTCYQKRAVAFFSDESKGYKYSNQIAEAMPIGPATRTILNSVNSHFNTKFNGILVNFYADGTQYISAHSDDERTLDSSGVVALSIGTERIFRVRDRLTKKIVYNLQTRSGKIIQMRGTNFQKKFTHEIPIQKRVKESRTSLTFRRHME